MGFIAGLVRLTPKRTERLVLLPAFRGLSTSSRSGSNDTPSPTITSKTSLEEKMTPRTLKLAQMLSSLPEQNSHNQQRIALARAITLVESTAPVQRHQGDLLLTYLLQHSHAVESLDKKTPVRPLSTFRVGIAGPPGVGKSTFIESLGLYVLDQNKEDSSTEADSEDFLPSKLAVVCIDPSSFISGGSILGDKTRMTELARHDRAFVRPCANGGMLGGLSAETANVVSLISHVPGYGELVFVESVGLGQSEIEIAQCVDLVLLMVPPGGGDELQGVKKGIVEIADMIIVNKADGDLLPTARSTAVDYRAAVKFLRPKTAAKSSQNTQHQKPPQVLLVSSQTGHGMDQVWNEICYFRNYMVASGRLQQVRQEQNRYWMWKNMKELITIKTQNDPILRKKAQDMEAALDMDIIPPRVAAAELIGSLSRNDNGDKEA